MNVTKNLFISLLLVGCLCAAAVAQTLGGNLPTTIGQSLAPPAPGSALTTNLLGTLPMPAYVYRMAQKGFGDRLNSYAWCMADFNGDLYVGTGRYPDTFGIMWELVGGALFPNTRPPQLPDVPSVPYMKDWTWSSIGGIPCVNDATKFAEWNAAGLAEIWRYNHRTRAWERVFQAQNVPSFLLDPATKQMSFSSSSAMGFRKMDVYKDGGGSVLYAFVGGFSYAMPGPSAPLIYCTCDGITWKGVATPLAMGRETRASAVFNGRLYVGVNASGSTVPTSVWCTPINTSNPTSVTWTKVLDLTAKDNSNSGVITLASFNDELYVGTQNSKGYQIWCGCGTPGVDDWEKIISDGATDRYNAWAGTMKVFNNHLYVGSISLPYLGGYPSMKGFDIICIDADHKWKCMVGGGQAVDPPTGYANLTSSSGQKSGFGNPMNFYCWSMEVFRGKLYVGTFDASVFLRYLKDYTGPLPGDLDKYRKILPYFATGADLWQTCDGVRWTNISQNGFGHQDNYGFRTMQTFSNSLMIGANNPFDGCEVFAITPMY